MKVTFAAVFALALAAVSTASAQRPDRKVEEPIVRTFNWFSYAGGDDIRSACESGGRNRVRLVYNAVWEEQVRAYEVFLQPDGTAGLDIGVLNDQGHGGNLSSLSLGSDGSNVTGPWRMRKGQRLLSAPEARELVGLLQASAAFGPPRDGLRAPSRIPSTSRQNARATRIASSRKSTNRVSITPPACRHQSRDAPTAGCPVRASPPALPDCSARS